MNDNQKLKEMLVFYDIINNLPVRKKRDIFAKIDTKIPVILSADDNYSCFVATTGASILYNTNSFIEFYILSDGITNKNKKLIEETFKTITENFSIKFVEVNAEKYFSQLQLINGHVTLNTCNRLLFPLLVQNVSRAIYLDVDLILIDDIKKLWDIDLGGSVYGAVPLFDRQGTVNLFKTFAKIPETSDYQYFNSGVLLIDYDKWRELKGSNENIVDDLLEILKEIKPKVTPDEVILNRFAYLNKGYKKLPNEFNVCVYYSYKYLKQATELSTYERNALEEYEKCIKNSLSTNCISNIETPVIMHFFSKEKPWLRVSSEFLPIPIMAHLKDFWFYASLTPYFEEIKNKFLYQHMIQESQHITQTAEKIFYTNIFQKIFSVKNLYVRSKKFKVITIFGIRIKFQKRNKK